ncbi:MAG TPA: hypothetical protein VGN35_02975 [Jatrophihabitantaceae bacterium]|jgi:hypothetical protein|nr:hypothetical protein [Jatrophihabitantaceae bacterium]
MRDESGRSRLPAATRTTGRLQPRPAVRASDLAVQDAADAALATTVLAMTVARTVFRVAARTSQEAVRLMPVPSFVRQRARGVVQAARAQGEAQRAVALAEIGRIADAVIPRTVEAVLARTDVGEVAAQLDVDAIVDRLDLDSIVARVDLDPIVARLDLIGLARYVVDGIDLPVIIRSSSGSMTTDIVRGIRRGSADADVAVERIVDRLLLRRAPRRPAAPNRPGKRRSDDRAT